MTNAAHAPVPGGSAGAVGARCATCGTTNRLGAGFCRGCGRRLPVPAPAGLVACVHCSHPNRPTAQFCSGCGSLRGLGALSLRGRYQVQRPLARGGMGAVYLAADTELFGRLCVVKELHARGLSPADQAEAERNFRREAEVLAALRHPSIPQIYDYFITDERYYLVMEYIEGENLAERVGRQGLLPPDELLRYADQVCDVLVYLAERQPPVVHRDIKPSNIILQPSGRTFLVDFGVAKPKAGRGRDTAAWGTMGYASPEQTAGRAEPSSDVYGLGATLYHLLTGDDPGDHPFLFPQLKQVASPLRELLERALAHRPTQRPAAHEVKTTLASLVAPEPALPLRLVKADVYGGMDRDQKPKGPPVRRFRGRDSALYICLHLTNAAPARPHRHQMFVQFYSPDGQLYRVRQHRGPIIVQSGQSEVHLGVMGLRVSGTRVVSHRGAWRAVVYLDECKLAELAFEIGR